MLDQALLRNSEAIRLRHATSGGSDTKLLSAARVNLLIQYAQTTRNWSYGVTVSTLDPESSDRGSDPRRTLRMSAGDFAQMTAPTVPRHSAVGPALGPGRIPGASLRGSSPSERLRQVSYICR